MSRKPTYEELEKNVLKLTHAERDLRRAEELLRDEISWRRMLVEQSRDGIVVLDQNGKVYEANKRYADMLGYSMEEVYQLHVWDWDAQFSKEQLMEMIRDVDDSGAHFETQHRRKDGAIVDIELSNNGAAYRGQKLIFCVCRDITERKSTQEALLTNQLRLSEAMELAHIVYWEVDRAANQIVANDSFYALHGTTAEQEGGYRMTPEEYARRFVHPDDLPYFLHVLYSNKNRLEEEAEFFLDLEHRIIRRDGEVRHVLRRVRVVQGGTGHPVRIYGVDQDITERKLAEQERERLILELEEALAKVKTLSGLLPVCASCKKIRNDQGYWEQMETYIRNHSEADFSHGICPECAKKLYPELYEKQ